MKVKLKIIKMKINYLLKLYFLLVYFLFLKGSSRIYVIIFLNVYVSIKKTK